MCTVEPGWLVRAFKAKWLHWTPGVQAWHGQAGKHWTASSGQPAGQHLLECSVYVVYLCSEAFNAF